MINGAISFFLVSKMNDPKSADISFGALLLKQVGVDGNLPTSFFQFIGRHCPVGLDVEDGEVGITFAVNLIDS